ncbi:MAG: hypothetical protein HY965_05640 [Ignavibacteriales bacterium]|nr:hypothetical protein [Ignavibacteriales bacterium]
MQISQSDIANIIAGISLLTSSVLIYLYLRERHMNKITFINDYNNQILKWYSKTIKILLKLKHDAVKGKTDYNRQLSALSAQIEIGRFYFPNIEKNDGYGAENSIAFRGYRNLALDLLVASYNLYRAGEPAKHIEQAKHLHKYFTSIIFEVVRPQENLDEIKKLTDRYYTQEKMSDDFHSHFPDGPVHPVWKKLT